MPSIGDMEYGFESTGVESYIAEVKASSLQKASDDSEQIGDIVASLEATWEGESRDKYIANLKDDIKRFQESLQSLYNSFQTEVSNASIKMQEFDKNLIR